MAEVMNMPVDSLDRRRDRKDKFPDDIRYSLPPPRRRDRDSRERRDDTRDYVDRPPRREYNDRNNPQNFRAKDYNKRRASPSDIPPYRERRAQSPLRRSPPLQPFKRPRRDYAGGYNGLRGCPGRGRHGPGDRRFGYDRELEERSGYFDDRPHGPSAGRSSGGYQSGPSEWDSGRGGYADAANMGNTQKERMVSYKQFIQELEDDILPAEAERRYQEYKSEYISIQKRAYFNAHKDKEWLKDKYHPTNLLSVIERRNNHARKVQKEFVLDLQSGTLDLNPGAIASSSNKLGHTSDLNSDDEVDVGGKRRQHGRESAKELDLSMAPKAHPVTSKLRRVQVDIEQARALVLKLDSEKGLEENILCQSNTERAGRDKSPAGSVGPVIVIRGLTSVKGLEGTELLDTLITYLWRVHALDYYGMIETAEARGLRHIRFEGKSSDVTSNEIEWEKKLDSLWQERLKGQDPLEVMTAKENIDAAAGDSLGPYVRKIRDEKYGWKYGCGAKGCTKLFHASEFVHKHLKLKHPELVLEVTSKMREDLYFQNYMSDKNAPGGTPVMQQSLPKEKPQRHTLGPNNRMKDERGRRARDNHANDSERYNRADNHQSTEFQLNNDIQAGSNPNESMFDAYGGHGMHVTPYHSDIPLRPVLMPVSGAGPLGPFIPAPPEVAVKMFREQGRPSPFKISGRNGCGSQLGGPAPVITLPPQFGQDPRRLRSYQDLDAPDDEVTVIDYRSL